MSNDLTSLLKEPQDPFHKAREILNKMRGFRIDPTRIKMTEPKPRARGGQASISIGTLIPREEVATWLPEQLLKSVLDLNLAVKKFEWDREDVEESAKSFKPFVNELSIMGTLSHPNVVNLFGFVEDMDKADAWILLNWEPNGNVREFLRSGEWEIPERISLIQDVAHGVGVLAYQGPPNLPR